MSKTTKIFKITTIVSLILLCIEIIMLFSQIDLIPIIIMGISCGLIIILRNRNEDFLYSENNYSDVNLIISTIFLLMLDLFLFISFILLGVDNLALYIIGILNTNKFIRFILYGIVFPYIISYFIVWFWSNDKPKTFLIYSFILPEKYGYTLKIVFLNFIIGLAICVFWKDYFSIATLLINLM